MEAFSTDSPEPIAFRTRDRRPVTLRRVRPGDTALLADLLGRLSERTWRLRYFTARPPASEAAWREAGRMTRGHAGGHLTLVPRATPATPMRRRDAAGPPRLGAGREVGSAAARQARHRTTAPGERPGRVPGEAPVARCAGRSVDHAGTAGHRGVALPAAGRTR